MFKVNDDLSIYCTRGDAVVFSVTAEAAGSSFKFEGGDIVRFKVLQKKACDNVVLQHDTNVTNDTEKVTIRLSSYDTRIGGHINKPVDYWYEIELNPDREPQTIVGYDGDGPKVFRLFPEGGEEE